MNKSSGTKNLGAVSSKMYELLQGLASEERIKVINSVLQLYGDNEHADSSIAQRQAGGAKAVTGTGAHGGSVTAQEYFAQKNPQNRGEMLAVAARYREQHGGGDVHQLNDFVAFFIEARQNFDRKNFVRDMKNAQCRAGLFNKGLSRGQYQLSYSGQQHVDALPDREALKKLKRPTRRVSTKRRQQKQEATK